MTDAALRLGYAGTPDIAAHILDRLIQADLSPVCILTRPDRPAGRGRKIQPGAVKQLAERHNLSVLQPANTGELQRLPQLNNLDLLIVVAYGMLLPATVLNMPRLGCINVHMSLLPRWRGAAPIQRAIEAGDPVTGVSIMQMDTGLDTGPILAQAECSLADNETAGTLHDKLASLGAETLQDTLASLATGHISPQRQDDSKATYAAKISKNETWIDWQAPAVNIERKIRAFNPVPVARTEFMQQVFRIWQARCIDGDTNQPAGTVLFAGNEGIDIATGKGILRLLRIQPAGKRVMEAGEFLHGHPGFFGTA